jgi:hypothetical protein
MKNLTIKKLFYFKGSTKGLLKFNIHLLNPIDVDDPDSENKLLFDLYYFTPKIISETIGKPPRGSGFKNEIKRKDFEKTYDEVWYGLTFVYDNNNAKHREYWYKLQHIVLNLIRWEKKRYYHFDDEFEKYVKKLNNSKRRN